MASTAGSIVLGIFADIAQLKTDLQRANQNIDTFAGQATRSLSSLTKMAGGVASAFAGIGLAFSATQIVQFIKSTTDSADAIGDLSERLGIGTDLLQAYQFAARDVGASADSVATGIAKLNKALGEAAGGGAAAKPFQDLNIAIKDAAGNTRTTEAALRDVADRISKAGSAADATAIATKFLGRGAAELIPIFKDGAAGADALIVKLRAMGLLVEADTIRQFDGLAKQFAVLSQAMSVAMMKAVITLEPQILALGGAFITATAGVAKFFEWFMPDKIASVELLGRRIAEVRAQIDREIAGRAQGGVKGFVFGLGSATREAKFRKQEADLVDQYEAAAARDAAKPKPPGGLTVGPDEGALAKRAAEAKKIRDKEFADLTAMLQFEETAREQRDIAANAQAALATKLREQGVADELAAYLARTTQAETFQADIDRYSAEYHAKEQERRETDITRDREAYLERVKQTEDFQAEIDKITADYHQKEQARLDADLAKRAAIFDKFFDPFTRAFETSVTGVIQGTTTLEAAFQKMGQSIAISLGETAVKEGVDALKKALKALLESELVKKIIQMGISAVGGMFGAGAGASVNVAPVQNINYGVGADWLAAGGIVQSPTFAVVGEAGPEAVVPLDRWGEMGGNVTVNIIDQRREGNVQTQEKTTASGERQVDVLITDVVRAGLAGGSYDRALGGSFGLSRRGVQR